MLSANTLEARLAHLAQSPKLDAETFTHLDYGGARLPLQVFGWGEKTLPAVYILAGVHGDEPGGIEAALRLLETLADGTAPLTRHRLLVIPCLNPSGLAGGTRTNRVGQDINRQFHADQTQESAALRRFLDPAAAAVLVDLHTDPHTPAFYMFELRQEGTRPLGRSILAALTAVGIPLEHEPFYAGYLGWKGLFSPSTAEFQQYRRTATGQSLAEWGLLNGIPRCYSLEAPSLEDYGRSAAMLVTALFALFAALEEEAVTAE